MRVVMIVEDEAVIRMIAVELLQDAGYSTVEFDNAADAMEFSRDPRNALTAVLTDINMPGAYDGLDVAHLVTTTRPDAGVVVMSGRYNLRPADLAPTVRFLMKPWTAAGMLAAISSPVPYRGDRLSLR